MTIKIKLADSDQFSDFIDIGRIVYDSAEEFQWYLPHAYLSRGLDKEEWYNDFKKSSPGVQLEFINYFFQFDNSTCPEITSRFMKANEVVKKILDFYYSDAVFTKGIEFHNLDESDGWIIEKQAFETKEDEYEDLPTEIYFEDGSVVLSHDKESIGCGRYIPQKENARLEDDLRFLVQLIFNCK